MIKQETAQQPLELPIQSRGHWFRLAHQYMERHEYEEARQALRNLLEISPQDRYARRLLAKLDQKEREYHRLRAEREEIYRAALEAWKEGNVSSALVKLERVLELNGRAPDTSDADRTVIYRTFHDQVRAAQQARKSSYEQALRHRAERDHAKALAACDEYLAQFPNDAQFQALTLEIEGQRRLELADYIAEVDRKLEIEAGLEQRVRVLEEAVERHPDERHFGRLLELHHKKQELVKSTVAEAEQHERDRMYHEAVGVWDFLRTIDPHYPGLDQQIDRLCQLEDEQTRAEAKIRCFDQIEFQLEGLHDYKRAAELAQKALMELPGDAEMEELQARATEAMNQIAEAKRLLSNGQDLCRQGRLPEGVELLRQAHRANGHDPSIRAAFIESLVKQAAAVVDTDWHAAGVLLPEVLELEPDHTEAASLLSRIADRKEKELLAECISQAERMRSAGELNGAISAVEKGLAAWPADPGLLRLHYMLLKELRAPRAVGELDTAAPCSLSPRLLLEPAAECAPPVENAPPAPIPVELPAEAPKQQPPRPSMPAPAARRVVSAEVKIFVATAAVALAGIGLAAYTRSTKIPVLPSEGMAKVAASEISVCVQPDSCQVPVVTVSKGTRLNVLELPKSQYGEWIKVQYVAPERAFRPGYVRSSDLEGWSSPDPKYALELLKIFGPEQWAKEAEMREHLYKLEEFFARFGDSPQAAEANLLMARTNLALAHLGRNAGRPEKFWQAHVQAAAEQLKAIAAEPALSAQARRLRSELEEMQAK
jgi:tetratricopeptide (TPR) repeat protein